MIKDLSNEKSHTSFIILIYDSQQLKTEFLFIINKIIEELFKEFIVSHKLR